MNMMNFFSRILVVMLTLSLILPVDFASAAEGAIQTKMKHESPDTFIPGFRIILEANITDEAGIREARCYFKVKDEPDFIFVDMKKMDGGMEAVLPAPDLGVKAVNYFFLSLNGKNKVARSQVFEIVEQDTDSAKDLKEAEQAKAKGKDVDLDNVKDRLMEKLEKEQKARLKKHQTAKKDGTIQAKTDASVAPEKAKGFRDKIAIVAVAAGLQYSMMKEGTATVTATPGGVSTAAVIAGLAVIAGGAALAAGGSDGGGGGGGSVSPVCGNAICEAGETAASCPSDCSTTPPPSPVCGNSVCETGETAASCPADCAPVPPAGTQLGGVVTAPNGPGSQVAPFSMQIINIGAVSVPVAVTYNGASIGTYTGTGTQDFPAPGGLAYISGGTGRLTLTQNVSGGQILLHFRTGGGQAGPIIVTGSANDWIAFQTN